MPDTIGELPDSFLDPALERLDRVEHALNHVGKAIELELADLVLDPSSLTDEVKSKLQSIGNRLLSIVNLGESVASDVGQFVDLEILPPVADSPKASRQRTSPSTLPGHRTRSPRRSSRATSSPSLAASTIEEVSNSEKGEDNKPNLYARLVNPTDTPEMKRAEGAVPVEVKITANDRISIGDREIIIANHNMFLLNALMLLRDKPRAAGEIRELGFYPEATNGTATANFSTSMKGLSELLNQAAGIELIKKVGTRADTRYCVNPNLVLRDERIDTDSSVAEGKLQLKKN